MISISLGPQCPKELSRLPVILVKALIPFIETSHLTNGKIKKNTQKH